MTPEPRSVGEALQLIEDWLPPMGMTSIPEEPIKPAQADALHAAKRLLRSELTRLRWFLEHRTAPEGGTQMEVFEQIDWSKHPALAHPHRQEEGG
jgi:hypothetical protein